MRRIRCWPRSRSASGFPNQTASASGMRSACATLTAPSRNGSAGFGVVEEAGTWIARSGNVEFFVWVKEEGDVYEDHLALLEDPDAFPVRETIQGVTVYGNESGWEWRTDGLYVFIRQGPDGDSKLPNLEELTPIVVASLDVPYPLRTA